MTLKHDYIQNLGTNLGSCWEVAKSFVWAFFWPLSAMKTAHSIGVWISAFDILFHAIFSGRHIYLKANLYFLIANFVPYHDGEFLTHIQLIHKHALYILSDGKAFCLLIFFYCLALRKISSAFESAIWLIVNILARAYIICKTYMV